MDGPPRRVGLSKKNGPADSLLKTIKRPELQDVPTSVQKTKSGDLDDDTNSPLSDVDDDEWDAVRPKQQTNDEEDVFRAPDSSDTEDGDMPAANIRKVNFTSATQPPPSSSSAVENQNAYGQTKESQNKDIGKSSQSGAPSSSARSKRSADGMTDQYGFAKKAKPSSNSRKYTSKSSQSKPRIRPPKARASSATEAVRKRLQLPSMSSSPEKSSTSRPQFQRPASIGSSPSSSPDKPKLRMPSLPSEHNKSPGRKRFKGVNFDLSDLDETVETTTAPDGAESSGRSLRSRNRKSLSNPAPQELSQKPMFKVPELEGLDWLDDDAKEALATRSSRAGQQGGGNDYLTDSSLSEHSDAEFEGARFSTARCPMCNRPVDADLLKKHSQNGRMGIRKQAAFCRLHKRKTAENTWSARGYPTIEWKTLDSRLIKHKDYIEGILLLTTSSHYRSRFRETVQSGKSRTLLKTEDSAMPGYYGPRGLRIMTDFIMRTFRDTIRKQAVEDDLISARTYTVYVEAVLVPELAVRLIMEDKNVPEEDAREIMQESREVGELLHEEDKDDVYNSDED